MRLADAQKLKVGQRICVKRAIEEDEKRGFGRCLADGGMRLITSVGTKINTTNNGIEYILVGTSTDHSHMPEQREVWPSTRL